jgi:hypothetical protein
MPIDRKIRSAAICVSELYAWTVEKQAQFIWSYKADKLNSLSRYRCA